MKNPSIVRTWGDQLVQLTDRVSVLQGAEGGKYPSGNSVLVQGESECIIIDPSIDVVSRGGAPLPVDAVLNSHAHEDHLAGNSLFPDARIHIHQEDLVGIQSIGGLMDIYGFEGEGRQEFEKVVVDEFHFSPRPDARGFQDGAQFDLGKTTVEAATHADIAGFESPTGYFFCPISISPDSGPTTETSGAIWKISRPACARSAMRMPIFT